MPLTVLSVAFPFAPVGPAAVGGAEQILGELDDALVSSGQTSLVVACEGSETRGTLFNTPLPESDPLDERAQQSCRIEFQRAIDRALQLHPVDLIHMHGMDFDQYTLPPSVPTVVTLHMPIAWYSSQIWAKPAPRMRLVCVSESQRQTCPAELRDSVAVVPNGVPIPPLADGPRQDYAIALGRICPEKNFHVALEAGTLAQTRVLLGGQVFPYAEHERYFAEQLQPLLAANTCGVRHEFLGPLNPSRRQQLLAHARCLLHPTLAPETSSLVAMEAIAAGTPVIAFRSGALPEIVEDGVTGFLVDNVEEMAHAIARVDTISPATCRARAKERFSREKMINRYFDLYHSIAQRTMEPAYA